MFSKYPFLDQLYFVQLKDDNNCTIIDIATIIEPLIIVCNRKIRIIQEKIFSLLKSPEAY